MAGISRAPAAPNLGLLFYGAKITDVLAAFFAHHRQDLALDPSLRGRVTVYLDGYDFRFGLSKLLRRADLTYRIVDGRYVVAPVRDPSMGAYGGSSGESGLPPAAASQCSP